MTKNKAHGRTDRGTNWQKMTTKDITSILNDSYTRGSDGQDYAPYREELEQELWRRQAREIETTLANMEREAKAYHKHQVQTQKTASKSRNTKQKEVA